MLLIFWPIFTRAWGLFLWAWLIGAMASQGTDLDCWATSPCWRKDDIDDVLATKTCKSYFKGDNIDQFLEKLGSRCYSAENRSAQFFKACSCWAMRNPTEFPLIPSPRPGVLAVLGLAPALEPENNPTTTSTPSEPVIPETPQTTATIKPQSILPTKEPTTAATLSSESTEQHIKLQSLDSADTVSTLATSTQIASVQFKLPSTIDTKSLETSSVSSFAETKSDIRSFVTLETGAVVATAETPEATGESVISTNSPTSESSAVLQISEKAQASETQKTSKTSQTLHVSENMTTEDPTEPAKLSLQTGFVLGGTQFPVVTSLDQTDVEPSAIEAPLPAPTANGYLINGPFALPPVAKRFEAPWPGSPTATAQITEPPAILIVSDENHPPKAHDVKTEMAARKRRILARDGLQSSFLIPIPDFNWGESTPTEPPATLETIFTESRTLDSTKTLDASPIPSIDPSAMALWLIVKHYYENGWENSNNTRNSVKPSFGPSGVPGKIGTNEKSKSTTRETTAVDIETHGTKDLRVSTTLPNVVKRQGFRTITVRVRTKE